MIEKYWIDCTYERKEKPVLPHNTYYIIKFDNTVVLAIADQLAKAIVGEVTIEIEKFSNFNMEDDF